MATATTTPVATPSTGLKARLELVTDKIDLESKPLYALAGVGDLAVHTVRELPATLNKTATKVTGKIDLEGRVATLRADLEALPAKAQTAAKELPAKAIARTSEITEHATDTVESTYGDLVARGEAVVSRIRKAPEVKVAQTQAKATVTKAKAARTTAKKAAASTRRANKAVATSAAKTAEAAVEAVEAAAAKIG
jgi:hypothetical protein